MTDFQQALRTATPVTAMKPIIAARSDPSGQPERGDAADQGERDVAHDDQAQQPGAEALLQHRKISRIDIGVSIDSISRPCSPSRKSPSRLVR